MEISQASTGICHLLKHSGPEKIWSSHMRDEIPQGLKNRILSHFVSMTPANLL